MLSIIVPSVVVVFKELKNSIAIEELDGVKVKVPIAGVLLDVVKIVSDGTAPPIIFTLTAPGLGAPPLSA
ncbi:hypothetical protein FLB_23200 [Flavobacterium succinicans]|uniref:Uncharacterized protein n=1 Tax=Flavobacterium succinicans TaxID=29536 RepID=A0A199XQK3_9FLAO|nr:hypothetical protein FLB_23200 [Flavobacterium succinicans]